MLRRSKKEKISEAQLCSEFRIAAEEQGWITHGEVDGWDLVLVPRPGATVVGGVRALLPDDWDGKAVGIQAKLLANCDVLHQAVSHSGVVWRFVLVRSSRGAFDGIAARLGIGVIERETPGGTRWSAGFRVSGRVTPYAVRGNLWLPPVVSDKPAGVAAPQQLTRWRVGALKLCAVLRERGYLTSADFDRENINMARWKNTWLMADGAKAEVGTKKLARWVATPGYPLPDVGWERIRDQLVSLGSTGQTSGPPPAAPELSSHPSEGAEPPTQP